MSIWSSAGGLVSSFVQGSYAHEAQQEAMRDNEELQTNANVFSAAQYEKSAADQRTANTLAYQRQEASNTKAWKRQKEESRYWANEGDRLKVASLRKAGINPMLPYVKGLQTTQQAPSPNAKAIAQTTSRKGASGASGSTSAVNADLKIAQNIATLSLLKSQKKNINANTINTMASASKTDTQERGSKLDNSAKSFAVREIEARSKFKTGSKGALWRNIGIPAHMYLDSINPFSGADFKNFKSN